MERSQLTQNYLDNLGYPYDDFCVNFIIKSWEKDHDGQLLEDAEFEIDEVDVQAYWFIYVAEKLFIKN